MADRAANFALDMRQLDPDMPLETIALVGDDSDGRFLMDVADKSRIDRTQMHVSTAANTHYTDAFVSERSHRRTHIYFGARPHFCRRTISTSARSGHAFCISAFGRHRVMDGPWGDDANGWVTVLKKSRAAGLQNNMELASVGSEAISRIVSPCLPFLDTLVVNDVEIGALSDLVTSPDGVTDIAASERAARIVLSTRASRTWWSSTRRSSPSPLPMGRQPSSSVRSTFRPIRWPAPMAPAMPLRPA